jgi:hypothetical protein
MEPAASPGGGHSAGGKGGYTGGIGACGYPQSKVSQEPRFDNCVRKRKKKKKHDK